VFGGSSMGPSRGWGGRRGGDSTPERPETVAEPLPDDVAQAVAAAGLSPEVTLSTDLGADGQYQRRWLAANAERLLVVVPNGGPPEIQLDLRLADARTFRVDNLVGTQILCAEVGPDDREVFRGTSAEARRFSKLRRVLADWAEGKEHDLTEVREQKTCPTCGRILGKDEKSCPNCINKRQALVRLLKYMVPHLWKAVLLTLLVLLPTLLDMLQPQLSGFMMDRVLAPGRAATSGRESAPWVAWMFGKTTDPQILLVQIIGLMALFRLILVVLSVWRGRIGAWLGYWVVHDIRMELYEHLTSLTVRYFDQKQTGAVMSRITQDTRAMQGFLIDGVQNLGVNLLTLIVIGIFLLRYNWQLTLLTVVPAPLVIFVSTAFWKKLRVLYGRLWQRWELLSGALQDSLSGIRVVKAFAGEEREIDRFSTGSAALADAGAKANMLRASIFPWISFSIGLGTLVVWYYGGRRVINHTMTLGEIMVFLQYLYMIYGPMQWISQLFNWFNETLSAAERVWEVLDEQPDVPEATEPAVMEHVEGRFTFEDVTFGYEPHEPVLKNVTLEVEPGEMIGLVGHSGAGKSTLINLVCRFYDVDEGRILVDGVDIRDIAGSDYRRNIGVVLQENFLFNGSILENIRYGNPDADLEAVIAAAYAANAHEFITAFPDGYDTVVGERGTRLSGGERQRISIARAVLHNPRILILDEATASVDTETERAIQEALSRLIKGRTTFAIAHRLSTLRHADRLVVIEKGRIAEVGTHDELMNKPGGTFKRLVEMQTELNRIQYIGG